MPSVEIVAVNQCSGNSRGFFEPRVAGGQLGNGAMGNARWKGVPLKAVLDRAGVQKDAKQVTFNGLDGADRRQDAGFREGARHRPGARRRGHAGLCHERPGPALPQRLPAPPRRAGLLRHLLGEASQRDHGDRQRVRRLLDEGRLSHPRQRLQLHRARHAAQDDGPDRPLHRALVHHQPGRRRQGGGRPADHAEGHRLRRRHRHQGGRRLDRRRQELDAGQARPGSRQVLVPRMAAAGHARGRQARAQGARHQQRRPDPADEAAVEPGRLPAQRRRNRHASPRREEKNDETLDPPRARRPRRVDPAPGSSPSAPSR